MRDKYTNRPRGFGFLTLEDEDAAARICQGTHVLDGRQVSCMRLTAPPLAMSSSHVASSQPSMHVLGTDRCEAIPAAESKAQIAKAVCGRAGSRDYRRCGHGRQCVHVCDRFQKPDG